MLLELAIGDAYGAGFEYVPDRRFISKYNDLSGYVKHPRFKQKPGTYTDDTQMSIAIAELMLEQERWTPVIVAQKFLDVFKRDIHQGYAGGFFKFLKKTKTGDEFLETIRPKSDKSGAAMRSGPLGYYPSIDKVIEYCTLQAKLTHNTPDGINSAVAAALMTHYFIYKLGPKQELPAFICQYVPGNWDEPWLGEVGSRGWMSVRAAISSVLRNDSLTRVLKSSISWGGDTDTVATIALAAASCCIEINQDFPEHLIKKLENGKFGKDYLKNLDDKLVKKKFK